MKNFQPRDYQELAHTQLVEKLKQQLKTLLVMATGSGKSKTIVSFIKKYEKHFHFVLVVKQRKLVNQLAQDTALFNLEYGVLMASHDMYDPTKNIQVCSIDTITARGEYPHIQSNKDLILIIDEADQAKSPTYQSMINMYFKHHPARTFLVGLTATPYNGLDFFDCYINPITPKQLRDRGFLVDYKYYIPKESIDYSNIIISKGEWSAKQVSAKLNTPSMIAACFESWLKHGDNRRTLVFCMDKKHAEAFCKYINDYFRRTMARFVYDKTSDEDREEIFRQFVDGEIIFLVNIRIITRGTDIPRIGTIIDCAATLNLNMHIQKLGRGSRINDLYDDCIVIDPAKNVLNNGHFYMEHPIDLSVEYKRKKSDLEVTQMKVCDASINSCFRAFEPQEAVNGCCPYCGAALKVEKKKKLSKYAKDKLFMESASEEAIEQKKMINEFKKILWKKKNLGKRYPNDIAKEKAHFDMLDKYGLEKILKIRKSIWIKDTTIATWKRKQYVPLGGM